MILLRPKRVKHPKQHFKSIKGKTTKLLNYLENEVVIITKTAGYITSRQIEMLRLFLTKRLKKIGIFKILIFPDRPLSRLLPESRMGAGKGDIYIWVSCVRQNMPIIKLINVPNSLSSDIITALKYKLSLKLELIFHS